MAEGRVYVKDWKHEVLRQISRIEINEHDLKFEACFRTVIGDIVKVSKSELKRTLDAKLQNWRFILRRMENQ